MIVLFWLHGASIQLRDAIRFLFCETACLEYKNNELAFKYLFKMMKGSDFCDINHFSLKITSEEKEHEIYVNYNNCKFYLTLSNTL